MTKKIILTFVAVCFFCSQINSQTIKTVSMKLVKGKPSVIISYDHTGKQEPLFEGETENRIWLRLHNNTKLKIFLCSFQVGKEYGDVGVFYNVEKILSFQSEDKNIPRGYGKTDNCDVFDLSPGKSVLFSLPNEHLGKSLVIKTQFFYGWTGNWEDDIYEGTTHFVTFGNDMLPK